MLTRWLSLTIRHHSRCCHIFVVLYCPGSRGENEDTPSALRAHALTSTATIEIYHTSRCAHHFVKCLPSRIRLSRFLARQHERLHVPPPLVCVHAHEPFASSAWLSKTKNYIWRRMGSSVSDGGVTQCILISTY